MTERQKLILKAIIKEFMRSASPVGSTCIVGNYNIGVSPATIRHEMVELSDMGYLYKAHSSSGREPTNLAFRFFVQELMEEDPVSNSDDVSFRLEALQKRFEEETIIRKVLEFLSEETGYASVCLLGDTLRHIGISKLTGFDELREVEVLETLLNILEDNNLLRMIFEKGVSSDVCLVMGDESGIEGMSHCAFVFSPFKYVSDRDGYIGVLGPRRMRYSKVIPRVRYVKEAIQASVRGW